MLKKKLAIILLYSLFMQTSISPTGSEPLIKDICKVGLSITIPGFGLGTFLLLRGEMLRRNPRGNGYIENDIRSKSDFEQRIKETNDAGKKIIKYSMCAALGFTVLDQLAKKNFGK